MDASALKAALLESCHAKLARADDHLQTLYRETDRWGDTNPITVTRDHNADGSEHLFRLRLTTQPDLWRWAVILGDALHNLRGALDHTVYGLAIAQTGKDPPDDDAKLAFPICSEPRFFERQRFRIASLNDATQAAVERAQPYNRLEPGKWFSPLWFLSQLHDIDKHRLAHLTPTAVRPNNLVIEANPGTFEAFWNNGPLVDGAPLLRVRLTEPNPNMKVNLNATASVVLELAETPPISLHLTMQRIAREVDTVCRYLSWFFPG